MIRSIHSIILKTEKISETYEFYKSISLPLESDSHSDLEEAQDETPQSYSCQVGDVRVVIYALAPWTGPERRTKSHDTMVGFAVDNLDEILEKLDQLNVKVVLPKEQTSSGQRAVVLDPDGRPVELSQSLTE